MKPQELTELEREAITLMNRNDFEGAARHWEELLRQRPDWEHGEGAYNLAVCFEETKRFEAAGRLYCEALKQEPENTHFLGGYASFLYLYGDSKEAFGVYTRLFRQARSSGNSHLLEQLMPALLELGRRLGISELQVREHLA